MAKYYYTFGMDEKFPFQGGWVEVIAPGIKDAHAAFRRKYPDQTPGSLNCSDYYTEREFMETFMYENGNFGKKCREVIRIPQNVLWAYSLRGRTVSGVVYAATRDEAEQKIRKAYERNPFCSKHDLLYIQPLHPVMDGVMEMA